jgi:hypothetical protein
LDVLNAISGLLGRSGKLSLWVMLGGGFLFGISETGRKTGRRAACNILANVLCDTCQNVLADASVSIENG